MVDTARAGDWRILREHKTGYLKVLKVERMGVNGREVGFFKYASPAKQAKYIGPLVANELIANRLGQLLHLPMARTELAHVKDRLGIVSVMHPGKGLQTWAELKEGIRKEVGRHLTDPRRLERTFVFDAWICNIDRSGKNIMVYKQGDRLDFYLIDHELSLLGAVKFENKPWNAPYWDNIRRYTRGYHPALLSHATRYEPFEPHIAEIQRLDPGVIRSVIDSCPSAVLSEPDRALTEELLLLRQKKLAKIIARCVQET